MNGNCLLAIPHQSTPINKSYSTWLLSLGIFVCVDQIYFSFTSQVIKCIYILSLYSVFVCVTQFSTVKQILSYLFLLGKLITDLAMYDKQMNKCKIKSYVTLFLLQSWMDVWTVLWTPGRSFWSFVLTTATGRWTLQTLTMLHRRR